MFECLFSHLYISYCETVVHCSSELSTPRLAADTACCFLCEGLGKSEMAVKNKFDIIGGNYIFVVNNIYMS